MFLYSVNFLRLCYIILENTPAVLRKIFKSQFEIKHKLQWKDSRKCGQRLMYHEKWKSKLNAEQKELLKDGNTNKWDATLLFHVLLYSSWCLFANKIEDTQFILKIESNKIEALKKSEDIKMLRHGGRIIIDLGTDPFCSTIERDANQIILCKHFPRAYQTQQECLLKMYDVYICQEKWECVQELSHIRNECYGHCTNAHVTSKTLNDIVKNIEEAYRKLKVPKKDIDAMKNITNGKVTKPKHMYTHMFI